MRLLKFYASWCAPCKNQTKVLETIEFPYEVVPVDIDEDVDLAMQYSIRTVPTLVLVDDEGSAITRLSDSKATKEELTNLFIS